jgi:hypothetical protein
MKKLFVFSVAAFLSAAGFSQTSPQAKDILYNNFLTPGNEAKPRVWWHWMNGNITQKVSKDRLMKRSALVGQNFDASHTPVVVLK